MLKLILIRHGETDGNSQKRYLGVTDISLNKNGIEEASKLKEKLNKEKIDIVLSSPLKRAVETANFLSDNIVLVDELREINFGLFDNLTYDEIVKKYPAEHKMWLKAPYDFKFPKGESSLIMHKRVSAYIDKLLSKNKMGTIVIVTHAGVIRCIISHLLGLDYKYNWHFKIENCSINEFQIDNEYAVMTKLNYN